MSAKLLDGRATARAVKEEVRERVVPLIAQGVRPGLAAVLVGDDPASQVYVRAKTRACEELGIRGETFRLPESITEQELIGRIDELSQDPNFHAILVQLPLPDGINEERILEAVSPAKDVDGFHPYNLGRLVLGKPVVVPCTPWGIQELLIRNGIEVAGRRVCIVGRSRIVGRPLSILLSLKGEGGDGTVTVCHSRSHDLSAMVGEAEIVVVAVGSPEYVQGEWLREGAVVVDVGINWVEDSRAEKGYRLVGDVHFPSAAERASAITPVPGGVGPMTVAMLMANTVRLAELQEVLV